MKRLAAFSLLEVLVAVTILGLCFTAIFASEAGAIKVGHRARHTGIATTLARCKMGEIEERVLREGLPAVDASDSDGCCEDAEVPGYTCNWRIDRVILPDIGDMDPNDLNDMERRGREGEREAASAAQGGMTPDTTSAQSMLQGTGPMGDAIAEMAVGFTMPVLRPAIEEQVRRATVTVEWQEGDGVRSFDVVQFLVAAFPMGGLDPENMPHGMEQPQGGMPGGGGGMPGGGAPGGMGGTQ
jgi:general secretion pathway protein I